MFPPKIINNNLRKLAFSGFAIACLTTSAYADSTYILQLGTSDTQEKAEQKWEELKSKNPDLLGSLKPYIAEVAMPPDNKISYRTQAGPITSNAAAEKLCNELLDKGNECYVIETAMFASDALAPASSTASTDEAPFTAPQAPLATPHNEIAASTAAQEATDKAVTAQNTTPRHLIVPAQAPRVFNDDETDDQDNKSAKTDTAKATAADTKSTEQPAAQKVAENDAVSVPKTTKSGDIIVPDRAPKFLDDDSGSDEQEVAKPAPAAVAVATPIAVATPVAVPQETKAPETEEASNKPGFFGRLFGASSEEKLPPAPPVPVVASTPAPEAMAAKDKNIVGNVSVAEAIRVPLTTETADNAATSASPAVHKHIAENDTASQGNASYWVQITYFADEQQAHYFYESFRNTYPDITDDLRMRITRPRDSESGHVTLRLGTFTNPAYINAVCSLAAKRSLHCTKIANNGPTPNIFSEDNASGNDGDFLTQGNSANTFWVQLGTYASSDEAWDKWKSIKQKDEELVSGSSAVITTPAMSDASGKLFRLRTGPFSNQSSAITLCNKLAQTGESCTVVTE